MARVLVLKSAGINCDEETVHAFRLAGAQVGGVEVELVHVGVLLARERRLREFDIFVVPGGFSYGDDLGAGTVLANQLRSRLDDDIAEFVEAGKLVLGICNGFQVLVRLGILPGWSDTGGKQVSLIENRSGKFEDRWVRLRIESERSPFLAGAGRPEGGQRAARCFRVPVAHKEGRFVARDPEVLERLEANGQVALRYCAAGVEPDERGEVPAAGGAYPANPNGSVRDIAGITNERGNVLGLMPHPERFVHALQDPTWTRCAAARGREKGEPDRRGEGEDPGCGGEGFPFFVRAVRYVARGARQGGFLRDTPAAIR
jgi:phosphoribosylformylglycinamidine synthase